MRYAFELGGLAVLAISGIVAYFGRKVRACEAVPNLVERLDSAVSPQANMALANQFTEVCVVNGPLGQQFARCRPAEGRSEYARMKESPCIFRIYLSGRRYCRSTHIRLRLKRRHDLLALLMGLVQPDEDDVIIESVMQPKDLPDMVVAVARNEAAMTTLKEIHPELGTMAVALGSSSGAAQGFRVMAELRELWDDLLL